MAGTEAIFERTYVFPKDSHVNYVRINEIRHSLRTRGQFTRGVVLGTIPDIFDTTVTRTLFDGSQRNYITKRVLSGSFSLVTCTYGDSVPTLDFKQEAYTEQGYLDIGLYCDPVDPDTMLNIRPGETPWQVTGSFSKLVVAHDSPMSYIASTNGLQEYRLRGMPTTMPHFNALEAIMTRAIELHS
jgi:hypothetical protein